MDLLDTSQSFHDGHYVFITLDGSLEDLEQEVDLIFVIVDITHRVKRSHNIFQVLVQFLSSGSNDIHSSGIEVLNLVTEIIQVCVKSHELVLRLPISNDLFRCVDRLINLLISL